MASTGSLQNRKSIHAADLAAFSLDLFSAEEQAEMLPKIWPAGAPDGAAFDASIRDALGFGYTASGAFIPNLTPRQHVYGISECHLVKVDWEQDSWALTAKHLGRWSPGASLLFLRTMQRERPDLFRFALGTRRRAQRVLGPDAGDRMYQLTHPKKRKVSEWDRRIAALSEASLPLEGDVNMAHLLQQVQQFDKGPERDMKELQEMLDLAAPILDRDCPEFEAISNHMVKLEYRSPWSLGYRSPWLLPSPPVGKLRDELLTARLHELKTVDEWGPGVRLEGPRLLVRQAVLENEVTSSALTVWTDVVTESHTLGEAIDLLLSI